MEKNFENLYNQANDEITTLKSEIEKLKSKTETLEKVNSQFANNYKQEIEIKKSIYDIRKEYRKRKDNN